MQVLRVLSVLMFAALLAGCHKPYEANDFLLSGGFSSKEPPVVGAAEDEAVARDWHAFAEHARGVESGWTSAGVVSTSPDGRSVVVSYYWPRTKTAAEARRMHCWSDWRKPGESWRLPTDATGARYLSNRVIAAEFWSETTVLMLFDRDTGRVLATNVSGLAKATAVGDTVLVLPRGYTDLISPGGPIRRFEFSPVPPEVQASQPGFALNRPIVVHDRYAVVSTREGALHVFSLPDGRRLDVHSGWWLQGGSPTGWGLALNAKGEPHAFRVLSDGRLIMGDRVPAARDMGFNRASPSGRYLHLVVFAKLWGSDQVVVAEPGDVSVVPPMPDYVSDHVWIAHDAPRGQPAR